MKANISKNERGNNPFPCSNCGWEGYDVTVSENKWLLCPECGFTICGCCHEDDALVPAQQARFKQVQEGIFYDNGKREVEGIKEEV